MIIRCLFVVGLRFELEFLIKSKGNSITTDQCEDICVNFLEESDKHW